MVLIHASIGIGFSHLGSALCLTKHEQGGHFCSFFQSSSRPSIEILFDWLRLALDGTIPAGNPQQWQINLYHPDDRLANKLASCIGPTVHRSTISWRCQPPIAPEQTALGLVGAAINEKRLQVAEAAIIRELGQELKAVERTEQGGWNLSPGVEAIVLSLGEAEYRDRFGRHQGTSAGVGRKLEKFRGSRSVFNN